MPSFTMQYSRTFNRKIDADTLETAAAQAKRACNNVQDCKLLAVFADEPVAQPEEQKQ